MVARWEPRRGEYAGPPEVPSHAGEFHTMHSIWRTLVRAALLGLSATASAHELTRTDAEAWLDGYMPIALEQGDVAGAVVVIVKDGEVLAQRGYGYADIAAHKRIDPATTLFRPGSVSKLFTWTAVMQLAEQGKIDLDADVNRYLDFQIPPYRGRPVTMRNLMTHTPGFEQSLKGLCRLSGKLSPMGEVLQRWIPERVFEPGTTPAYSNYGAGLAGYIVQRVSGLPFEEYAERYIFQPLGMTHSTFRQPLPAPLAPFMARGYPRASVEATPFELVEPTGAGGSSVSGPDMAKFMIAHLNEGAGLMKPETARLMHTPAYGLGPGTNRMALGFYETRINDLSAIGHAGDSLYFHSEMWLFPSRNVGLFISMNSTGTNRAVGVDRIRKSLFELFADRYFPAANEPAAAELPTAREHAAALVGSYSSSQGSFSNFADIANFLDQVTIGLDPQGRPSLPAAFNPPGEVPAWIEIEPFVWKETHGRARLGAQVENGKVVRWSLDDPTNTRMRVPWYRDAAWLQPLLLAGLLIIALTALSWPVGAIARRFYGPSLSLNIGDRRVYHLIRFCSWLVLGVLAGWMSLLADFIPLVDNDGSLDWRIRLLQLGGTLGTFGLVACALWNLMRVWKSERGRFTKLRSALVLLAAAPVLWVMLEFHLINFSTHY